MQQAGARERGELNNQTRREVANQQNAYHYAQLGEKERLDSANISFKEQDLKIKAAAGAKGGKLTATQSKYITEFSIALNAFEKAGIEASAKRQKAPNYGAVREELANPYETRQPSVTKNGKATPVGKPSLKKVPTATDRLMVQAAEEVWRTHYVSQATAKALGLRGLPESGWNSTLKRG